MFSTPGHTGAHKSKQTHLIPLSPKRGAVAKSVVRSQMTLLVHLHSRSRLFGEWEGHGTLATCGQVAEPCYMLASWRRTPGRRLDAYTQMCTGASTSGLRARQQTGNHPEVQSLQVSSSQGSSTCGFLQSTCAKENDGGRPMV